MARIVVVSQSEDSRTKLYRLLTSSGFQVFRSCSSGSELRRALSESEDCVVVMIGYAPDCKPDDLLWDYKDSIQILLIAKQAVLENVESPEIFRLTMPASGQAVIGAVEIVDRAKAVLMKQKGLSEPEAHRTMQQYAMNHGMKMAEFAAQILKQAGE